MRFFRSFKEKKSANTNQEINGVFNRKYQINQGFGFEKMWSEVGQKKRFGVMQEKIGSIAHGWNVNGASRVSELGKVVEVYLFFMQNINKVATSEKMMCLLSDYKAYDVC